MSFSKLMLKYLKDTFFLKRKKLIILIIILIATIINSLIITLDDNLKKTRKELEYFQATELNNCKITSIITRRYPPSRPKEYKLFKTSCSQEYYPILLERNTQVNGYDLFEKGVIISKKSNSRKLKLNNKGDIIELYIRNPLSEDCRKTTLSILLYSYGFIFVPILLLPNAIIQKSFKM